MDVNPNSPGFTEKLPTLFRSPVVAYDTHYVGEVMSCHVSVIRSGVLQRPSDRTWQRDRSLGATTLTIPFGHTVDAFRYVVGDFSHVAAVVSTQATQWLKMDTQRLVDVTAPDNVLVSGCPTIGPTFTGQ